MPHKKTADANLLPFTVVVLRPDWFLHEVEDFDDMHDMQYVADVHAPDMWEAAKLGRAEVYNIDRKENQRLDGYPYIADHDLSEIDPSDYTVLGVVPGHGAYKPILNRLR